MGAVAIARLLNKKSKATLAAVRARIGYAAQQYFHDILIHTSRGTVLVRSERSLI